MNLTYKPNFDESREYWRAYWEGEIIDRPAICIRAFRDGSNPPSWPRVLNALGDSDAALREYDVWASQVHWLGEAVPFLNPNFGPDQFGAWIGGDLHNSSVADEYTSWAVPVVNNWDTDALNIDRPQGVWWDRMLDFMRRAAEYRGRFVPGVPDIHSNMDALVALRGPQDLCTDFYDVPEKIDAAMDTVRRAFAPAFEGVEEAGGLEEQGYIGWLPFYCEQRFAVIQCDLICMVRPEHFRRWILPALQEEASYLDHCCYHLDGPDALVHLKDILSIEEIDAIQWVPGAGNPPPIEWMDLLIEIQNAGKGLYLGGSCEEVKVYHKALRPEGVLYDVWASSVQEAEDLLAWLKSNT